MKFSETLKSREFSIIASLPRNDYALAKAAWENGAAAVKVHINLLHRAGGHSFGPLEAERETLERIAQDCPVPLGIVAGVEPNVAAAELDGIAALGFSFVSMYTHHAPVALARHPALERMLAVDGSYSTEQVRALGTLHGDILEASIMEPGEYGAPLNLRDILRYAMLAEASDLPVVVPTQKAVQPEDIAMLKEIGVKSLMIGAVVAGDTAESFAGATARYAMQ